MASRRALPTSSGWPEPPSTTGTRSASQASRRASSAPSSSACWCAQSRNDLANWSGDCSAASRASSASCWSKAARRAPSRDARRRASAWALASGIRPCSSRSRVSLIEPSCFAASVWRRASPEVHPEFSLTRSRVRFSLVPGLRAASSSATRATTAAWRELSHDRIRAIERSRASQASRSPGMGLSMATAVVSGSNMSSTIPLQSVAMPGRSRGKASRRRGEVTARRAWAHAGPASARIDHRAVSVAHDRTEGRRPTCMTW